GARRGRAGRPAWRRHGAARREPERAAGLGRDLELETVLRARAGDAAGVEDRSPDELAGDLEQRTGALGRWPFAPAQVAHEHPASVLRGVRHDLPFAYDPDRDPRHVGGWAPCREVRGGTAVDDELRAPV